MPNKNSDTERAGRTELEHVVFTFRIMVAAHAWTAERLSEALKPFGYSLDIFTDGTLALKALDQGPWDLVIGSSDLPHPDGFMLLRSLRARQDIGEIPFLMVVSSYDPDEEIRAFQLGADEVINEATGGITLRARVRVLLRLSTYRQRLQNEKRMLGIKVAERTRELMEITLATVAALEKATELSDPETGHHILRVASYSALIAEEMGLGQEFVDKIRLYAPLHDVGKVGVPDQILKKGDILSAEEFEEMKKHTIYGYELLSAAKADPMACNIALCHHERYDGTGYPRRLKGEVIPIEARIVAVADVFDALITARRYKAAFPVDAAIKIIVEDMAKSFDPMVLRAFARRRSQIIETFRAHR